VYVPAHAPARSSLNRPQTNVQPENSVQPPRIVLPPCRGVRLTREAGNELEVMGGATVTRRGGRGADCVERYAELRECMRNSMRNRYVFTTGWIQQRWPQDGFPSGTGRRAMIVWRAALRREPLLSPLQAPRDGHLEAREMGPCKWAGGAVRELEA